MLSLSGPTLFAITVTSRFTKTPEQPTTPNRSSSSQLCPCRTNRKCFSRSIAPRPYPTAGDPPSFWGSKAWPPLLRPGRSLTPRAAVGGTVHEGLAADRCAAARARLAFPPVHGEGAVEVAAAAVDVDVEGVEGGATLAESVAHHLAGARDQLLVQQSPLDSGAFGPQSRH